MDIREQHQAIEEQFACEHEQHEVRRMTQSNGRIVYASQCLRCGYNIAFVKKDTLGRSILTVSDFDKGLRERWNEERSEAYQSAAVKRQQEWWGFYHSYINSDKWREEKRLPVLKRDGWLCQGCLDKPAVEVHHLTYKHLGDEPLFELVAVCKDCHRRIHEDTDEP